MTTQIERDAIAFCWSPSKGFHIMLPEVAEDRQMMDQELFVASCFMASNDKDFYDEMVATIKEEQEKGEDKDVD